MTTTKQTLADALAEAQRLANILGLPFIVGQTDDEFGIVSYPEWLQDPCLNWDNIWTIQPEAGR